MFKGSLVALITPFRDGAVDETAFQEHVAWQLGQGTHGLVPIGTTGECPALEEEEQERLIALTRRGRQGPGAGHPRHRLQLDRAYDPRDQGREKGRRRRGAGRLPLLQQADPGRALPALQGGARRGRPADRDLQHSRAAASVDMSNATMARLAKLPNIVGVKDATNDLARPLKMRVEIGGDFCLLSGEDATAVAYLAQGGDGVHLGDGQCRAARCARKCTRPGRRATSRRCARSTSG